jgi:hypothetical protein
MPQGNQTKAERRQARAAAGKPERKKQAKAGRTAGGTKAERRQARADRKRGSGASQQTAPESLAEDASPEERIEWRLERIEEAVAAQSERSEELLNRVNEVLDETLQAGAEPGGGDAEPA